MSSIADLVRRGYDAFNRQDWVALQDFLAPDMELERASGLGTVRGADDVIGFAAPGAFESQRLEINGEIRESGDRLLVPLRGWVRGAGSALELEQEVWHVATIRDGRVVRLEVYFDGDEALAAFGA